MENVPSISDISLRYLPIISTTTNESADMVPALKLLEHGNLHLEHLLGLLGRLQLEGNLLLRHEVDTFVDLAEAAASDFSRHFPSIEFFLVNKYLLSQTDYFSPLLDDVSGLEQIFRGLMTRHDSLATD